MRASRRTATRATQPMSLADQAYAALEEMIVTLKLVPGSLVSEATLAGTLGIGRTPIREAFQRLARDKLVVIHASRGIFVADINVKTQLRLLETRRELERLVARTAARRATEEERTRLIEIAASMEGAARTNDEQGFIRLDRELHTLTASATHNEFTEAAIGQLHAASRRFWFMHGRRIADVATTAWLHANLARAIVGGDEAKAEQATDELMKNVEEFTRASLSIEV